MFFQFGEHLINLREVVYFRERSGDMEIKLRDGSSIILKGQTLKDLSKLNESSITDDHSGWFLRP